MRVITEETDNTSSKGYSHLKEHEYRHFTPPREYLYPSTQMGSAYYYRNKAMTRNRHSVTMEESRALSIN